MKFLRQLFALLLVNLSGMTQRVGSALTIVVGVTCAVGVLVSMLAMGTGARQQQTANVRPDRVVLTTRGTVQGQARRWFRSRGDCARPASASTSRSWV
jgi:hypothetical protein